MSTHTTKTKPITTETIQQLAAELRSTRQSVQSAKALLNQAECAEANTKSAAIKALLPIEDRKPGTHFFHGTGNCHIEIHVAPNLSASIESFRLG